MFHGPDQVVVCSHCNHPAKYRTLLSGNTFGASRWTDGKQIATMLPRPPAVVKCRKCSECYWLAEAQHVGNAEEWSKGRKRVPRTWGVAQLVEEPTEEEYYRAIEKGLAKNPEQEKRLRILAWWRRNDAFRCNGWARPWSVFRMIKRLFTLRAASSEPAVVGVAAAKKNLEILAGLLDGPDLHDLVMKAEALRELGEFESAKRILTTIASNELASVIRQMLSLCESGDMQVRELAR